MKATERTIEQLLHSGDQYVIPVFQRYYTWGKDNWRQIWDDIETLLEPGQERKHHFLGSIVSVPGRHEPGTIASYQVIDGQQRITTLSIILCALRDLAIEYGHDELAAEINENYLIHKFKKGPEKYKVFPRLRDRLIYQTMVDDPGTELPSSTFSSARAFFRDILLEVGADVEEKARILLRTIADRLDFVSITLNGESPYKIFKSLNSTGVDLGQQDLIRNHVFMSLPLSEQDQFDEEQWRPIEDYFTHNGQLDGKAMAGFFRDTFMNDGTYIKADSVADEFERRHPADVIDPYRVVSRFRSALRLYKIMYGTDRHVASGVTEAIARLRRLDVTTANPLVLSLLEMCEAGDLTITELKQGVDAISSFVLRRSICSEKTRQYGHWFCAACKDLRLKGLDGMRNALHQRGWPDDDRFREAFLRYPLYGSDYGRVILEALEVSVQNPQEPVLLDECTIEHVLPQTIPDDTDGQTWRTTLGPDWETVHSKWLHTPGNLTLVGSDYNSSMQNRPFAIKKLTLGTSRVYLNKHFSDPTLMTWSEPEIVQRGQELARLSIKLWPRQ